MILSEWKSRKNKFSLVISAFAVASIQACAPSAPSYRTPIPPSAGTPSVTKSPQTIPPPPPTQEAVKWPLPQEAKISEQDLKKGSTSPPALKESAKETRGTDNRIAPEPAPPLRDDSSLLAKITPGTTPQRAVSLRLTEEGRNFLDAGDPNRALSRFEKTIVIDSTNPYGYFYLAKTHYRLGRYKESLNFLDVAESRLSGEPFWLAEVYALRGENFRALGMMEKAEASYTQALSLNSGNRTASDALSRFQGDAQAIPR